ncbi:hypothetical protein AK88_02995 [Plasmodium fragile]|uniref:Uncharacterized protein n=1 Tax=Plasmodium fragile TaxID=5857 RepID=A0A0D9QJS7_PLAFR|nr:uncharacterized protein AK88_02995 [Plasmodium fragile]KJP87315.1 hypothetical protein AK88_02995 [Plasmodium fragile]
MITLKDKPSKEKSSCFLFKKTLILSLFLWICLYWNNEGTISKALDTGHSIDTTLNPRCNRLLAKHEFINTVDEENIKKQVGHNKQKKTVHLRSGDNSDNEAANLGKVKRGNSSKSQDVKGLNLKFGDELKRGGGKNGKIQVISELNGENNMNQEEQENNQGQKSENEMAEEVEGESDDRRSQNELTETDADAIVESECDDGKSDNEITTEVLEAEGEGDDNTGGDKLIYEVNEGNDDTEIKCKGPKNRIINIEVFLEKKVEKQGIIKIELILEEIRKVKDKLLCNVDNLIRTECVDYFDGEGDDDDEEDDEEEEEEDEEEEEEEEAEEDDDEEFDQDENNDKGLMSTNTKKKRKKQFMLILKKIKKILSVLNIIGMLIDTVNRKLEKHVEKLMFKVYAKVDEYKKDPNISKNKYQMINITYKAFFFIIPIMIVALGIGITQLGSVGTYGSGILIMMGISFFIGNIKRSIKYQFKRKGIEKPGIEEYIGLLEKFLLKFEKQEECPEGEKSEKENIEDSPEVQKLSNILAFMIDSLNY